MTLNAAANVLVGASEGQIKSALSKIKAPIVFTNGCFDILHRGHVSYLETARNLGASLVVGVNSDASVKRQNKGKDRPLNNLQDRANVLAALACVDLVIDFADDTPLDLIKLVKPNHLVKGGDWQIDAIVGASFVESLGGKVHSIAFIHDRSTTKLVNKIRRCS